MGIVSYYLATSLDGYLARKDGSVDWLNPYHAPLGTPYDYEIFYKTVSAVIMGKNTWEVAKSFEEKPYADRETYIFSNSLDSKSLPDYAKLISKLNPEWILDLKKKHQGRIWIVGGANLATQLLELNLVDEIVQTIVPVSIGEGIPWIGSHQKDRQWTLNEHHVSSVGLIQLIYHIQPQGA